MSDLYQGAYIHFAFIVLVSLLSFRFAVKYFLIITSQINAHCLSLVICNSSHIFSLSVPFYAMANITPNRYLIISVIEWFYHLGQERIRIWVLPWRGCFLTSILLIQFFDHVVRIIESTKNCFRAKSFFDCIYNFLQFSHEESALHSNLTSIPWH